MNANLEREAQERKRRERLSASLRENLKRRKAQQRGRAGRDVTRQIETESPAGQDTNWPPGAGEG
jgi:hypothetical protein